MVKNKDKWSALSMLERADLIKLYVRNGITSLDTIKKDYNSFGDGGDKTTNPSQQNTNPFMMTPVSMPSVYSQKALEDAKEAVAFKYRNYSEEELREHIRNVRAGLETEFTYPDGTVIFRTKDSPIEPEYPTDFTGLGDVVDAYHVMKNASEGNFKEAAIGASLLLLPDFLGKTFRKGTKTAKTASNNIPEVNVRNTGQINSPGNAEAIPLDKNAAIINKQSLGQLSSKNPSKLTPEERAGMSRHDRTNVVKEKDAMIQKMHNIDYTYTPYIENTGVYTLRPAHLTNNVSRDDIMNTLIEKGKDQSIINFYDFVQTLPKDIDPKFMPIPSSKGMVQNPYITHFRDSTIDPEFGELLTDGDLARFLTFYDKQLSEGVTGALKDIPVWHASSADFNVFDYISHLGENMENTGVYGPGNYFTTRLPINHYAGLNGRNIKPYYITNIEETIPASMVMGKKGYPKHVDIVDGLIPEHRTGNIVIVGENTTSNNSSFNMFLPEVMSNGELVGSKLNNYYDNNVFEISLPRNTGIKSLYPNMSRFVRNADGSVSFIPVDWNDARVDFKNGGKLNLFETGGPKDKKQVEDVVRTTRGATGEIFSWSWPFVDVNQLGYLRDAWKVMKGDKSYIAPKNDNYTGAMMSGVGVLTDNGLGFVSQQDLENTLGHTPKDFVDAYVYGDIPFEELGVFKKEKSPERHVIRSKVNRVEAAGKNMNTYQTHKDTLDVKTIETLDSLLNSGKVDLHSENTTYEDSPFNIGSSGVIYDGNNSTIVTAYLPNGMPVSKAVDVFDTDPLEWNYDIGPMAKTGLKYINDNTNPFIMTTPWYYPIAADNYRERLKYLFGIDIDRDYNVRSNTGDKNGVVWDLHEALEWLDSHSDLTEMPIKNEKD